MKSPTKFKIFKQIITTILGSLLGVFITVLAVGLSDLLTPKYAIALVAFVAGWLACSLFDQLWPMVKRSFS